MKNICKDDIFPSFVYSMDLENVNNSQIVCDILRLKDNVSTINKSNVGGWHSPFIDETLETTNFSFLKSKVEEAIQFVLTNQKVNNVKLECDYWVNINNQGAYNALHSHSNVLITAVYYPFVPLDSNSNLVFVRTDGGSYFEVHKNSSFSLLCRTGMLAIFSPHLFHYVDKNNSKENRISIAFNFLFKG